MVELQRIEFHVDPSFRFPKQSPFKDDQEQINRGRVKRIDIFSELEDFRGSASLGFSYNAIC